MGVYMFNNGEEEMMGCGVEGHYGDMEIVQEEEEESTPLPPPQQEVISEELAPEEESTVGEQGGIGTRARLRKRKGRIFSVNRR
jgi:hypothetical protein